MPNFAQTVGTSLVLGEPIASTPAMLVQAADAEASASFDPTGELDLSDPQSVGYYWYRATLSLPELLPRFESLCLKPGEWRDQPTLPDLLEGFALASRGDPAIEASERMALMRMILHPGSSVQVFGGGAIGGPLRVVTMVRHEGE